ncbi:hypothetical protein BH23BAC3_BH23BAC3_16820 [soil metagenome]
MKITSTRFTRYFTVLALIAAVSLTTYAESFAEKVSEDSDIA